MLTMPVFSETVLPSAPIVMPKNLFYHFAFQRLLFILGRKIKAMIPVEIAIYGLAVVGWFIRDWTWR